MLVLPAVLRHDEAPACMRMLQQGLAAQSPESVAVVDATALAQFDSSALAVLLGQGTGGGALALVPADRVLACANGWLGPLPPEGASAIVHRDVDHADVMAAQQGVRATDLWRAGIVDRVVPERPDAADEPDRLCIQLARGHGAATEALQAMLRGIL